MADDRSEQAATQRSLGILLAELRSSADDRAWRGACTRAGVRPGHIADVEAGRKWPSRDALRAYAAVSGKAYDELLNLKAQLRDDPTGPIAQQLDKVYFQRRWGNPPPPTSNSEKHGSEDKVIKSAWDFAQTVATKPRQLEKFYMILPWLPAFLIFIGTLLSGAPTELPAHFDKVWSYPKEVLTGVVLVSVILSAVVALLTEYGMRSIQTKVRRIPGVRGVWRERNHYFATRVVREIEEDLRRAGELVEVESAGAAAETLERFSVIAPVTGLVVLVLVRNQGDAVAYWISGACLLSPLLSLPLSVAAVRHSLIVTRHAQGDD